MPKFVAVNYTITKSMKHFLLLLLPFFFACQLQRQPEAEEIVGRWQVYSVDGNPTVIVELEAEGRFNVRNEEKKKPSLWGNYQYENGLLKLVNEGGKYSDRCRDTGSYSLFLSDDRLEFVLVEDDCPSRKLNTQGIWQKIAQ